MPSQDTWSLRSGEYLNSWSGRKRTWVNTPNFHALPKDQKPVNAYDDWRASTQTDRVTAYSQVNGGQPVYYYNNQITINPDQIFGSKMMAFLHPNFVNDAVAQSNSAMVKALGKVSDAKVNLAVMAAEAHKTSDLILDTANRIDKAYRAFRKGHFREVARQLHISPKTVHKSWLEYRYGWLPLLYDVKGSAEFFAQQTVSRKPRFTVTAQESREWTRKQTTYFVPWGQSSGATASFTESLDSTNVAKVKLWLEITNPTLSEVQQLGLTNPALVAWELVPYSFVFDWFISVGNYLQAYTALDGVTVRRALKSNYLTHKYVYNCAATKVTTGNTTYNNGTYHHEATNRHYARSVPSLNPSDLYPPRNNGLNFTKLITSLALLRGTYRGHSGF